MSLLNFCTYPTKPETQPGDGGGSRPALMLAEAMKEPPKLRAVPHAEAIALSCALAKLVGVAAERGNVSYCNPAQVGHDMFEALEDAQDQVDEAQAAFEKACERQRAGEVLADLVDGALAKMSPGDVAALTFTKLWVH
jgi:hypothetical protein